MCTRQPQLTAFDAEVVDQVIWDVRYEGYINRQHQQIERQQRMATKRIPLEFDYEAIRGLRTEAKQKLLKIQPANLDQASRISGITPADIALLLAHVERRG